jgi:hypothetical protein
LAAALEQGAAALITFVESLSDAEWRTIVPKDGRPVGVVVHHVADVYPIEIQLAQKLASGGALTDVTWDGIHEMNAGHHHNHASAGKAEALEHLRRNSAAAAVAIRALSDTDLDRVAPNSLYGNAPLTCQFMLEDHAVRHSYHHLAKIRQALKR